MTHVLQLEQFVLIKPLLDSGAQVIGGGYGRVVACYSGEWYLIERRTGPWFELHEYRLEDLAWGPDVVAAAVAARMGVPSA